MFRTILFLHWTGNCGTYIIDINKSDDYLLHNVWGILVETEKKT